MKSRFFFWSLAFAFVTLSCTDKLSEPLMWDEGVMAAIPGYEDVDGTRVDFTNGLGTFYWTNGDCIGVCRSSASSNGTAAFTLLKGGETVGNFINDSFSLLSNTDYYAFYPFSAGTTATAFRVNLVGQVQSANNDVSHIGKYNYMSAKFTTNSEGKASFTFSNIGAVIQLHFTAEAEDTYKALNVTSSGSPFTTVASYDLSAGTYTATSTNASSRLSFGEEGLHVLKNEAVTVTMVVLPDDLSQSTLTFTIRNVEGTDVKEMSFAGYAFSRGKLYHFYEVDSKGNPPYGGCPDNNHPHAIDLGLPSGILVSCMDLGAEVPTECGFGYSWGQSAFAEKSNSNWTNYEFMNESYNSEWGITKYQVEDNLTQGIWYEEGTFVGDNLTTLQAKDDAAAVHWGDGWRMPTKDEGEEIFNFTQWQYVKDYNGTGIWGIILYKKKANNNYSLWDPHVFIQRSISYWGPNHVVFWTSSLDPTNTRSALCNGANPYGSGPITKYSVSRTSKIPIRPVKSASNGDNGSQSGGRP